MAKKTRFQTDVEDAVIHKRDSKLNPREVLRQIFKTYIAKMLEINVSKNGGRIESAYLNMLKSYMINEFRNVNLQDYQLSEKAYDDLFNETIQEIFNDAGLAHKGMDVADTTSQQMVMDKNAYEHRSKLWVPKSVSRGFGLAGA